MYLQTAMAQCVYTIHYTLYTIHFALYTIHLTLYTISHTLYTIHYKLYTILLLESYNLISLTGFYNLRRHDIF